MLLAVSNALAEVQARQIVQKMRALRNDVLSFAEQARLLTRTSKSIDSRTLMQEADNLLKKLLRARTDFQNAESSVSSVKRSLPSAIPKGGGMAPAAQWGNELRAGSKQFIDAVRTAEECIQKLYKKSEGGMNSPTRTSTGDPSGALDVLMTFIDGLTRLIEYYKNKHK